MAIKRIFHQAVTCSDIEVSLKFYRDTLGMKLTHRLPGEDGPLTKIMGFKTPTVSWDGAFLTGEDDGDNATVLDLIEWKHPNKSIGKPPEVANHLGIPRMAFLVDNIDEMYEQLVDEGVEFLSPPGNLILGTAGKLRAVFFRDPDGQMLELIEIPYAGDKE